METIATHISPLVTIRRERFLPQKGKVTVRKGQRVSAEEVVAICEGDSQFVILDFGRGLGLSAQKADKYLQVKIGQEIEEKDILAGPVGWAKRVVRSPYKGQVVTAGDGKLLIKVTTSLYELRAGFDAVVADIIAERGVILETNGALLQGIWGNGKSASGVLMNPYQAAEQELTADFFTFDMRDSILIGGWISNPKTLSAAAEFPLRGLILGGLEADLIEKAKEMPYPILVLDAIGISGMNSIAYQILSSNERRQIAVNAWEWDRIRGIRPEAIIAFPDNENEIVARDLIELNIGQTVRLCRAPYAGKLGRLERLNPGKTILANGLSVNSGEIRLEDGEKVIAPLENMEVIF